MNFAQVVLVAVLAGVTPAVASAQPPATAAAAADARVSPDTTAVAAAMAEAAERFLAALDERQRTLAVIPFDDPRRLDWHNIPKPDRKGVSLRDMTSPQQQLAHALVRAGLSDAGYETATTILALESNLKEGEKRLVGGHLRDPQRYFVTIFGQPAAEGDWGWSIEGHHLSLNFTIRRGQVVCDTPSFWGACPATVKTFVQGGPPVGARPLAREEQLAFDLLGALDPTQRACAVIAAKAPDDYRAAGQPEPPHEAPAGLVAGDMTPAQRQLLRELLAAYASKFEAPLAEARLAAVEAAGLERVHFAWLGATEPSVGHAYRVQGPTFVLEFVNIQSDPAGNPASHIHSVWRTLPQDFALTAK